MGKYKKYMGIIIIIIIALIYLGYNMYRISIQSNLNKNDNEIIATNVEVNNVASENKIIEKIEIINFKEDKEKNLATFEIKNDTDKEIIIDNCIYLIDKNKKQLNLKDYLENTKEEKRKIPPNSTVKLTINTLSKYKEIFISGYNKALNFNDILLYKPVYKDFDTKEIKGVILSNQNKELLKNIKKHILDENNAG